MRPNRDEYFLDMARLVARRSTCHRRAVGCVLVDVRGHVVATGYNGVPSGWPHCNEFRNDIGVQCHTRVSGYPYACGGATAASGTNLEGCEAIHAEQNALLQCGDAYEIETCYVTTEPCITCTKLLLNTSCARIVTIDRYPGGGHDMWLRGGRYFHQYATTE